MNSHPPVEPEGESDDNFAAGRPAGDPTEDQSDEPISRSQRKREAEQITRLGERISGLSENDLRKLPLDERVRAAVDELRKIRSFGARKRQLHYLGKVLRNAELAPIHAALKAIQLSANAETRLLHASEKWRDRLLTEGNSAIEAFLQDYPDSDRQQIRQLVRNHGRESARASHDRCASVDAHASAGTQHGGTKAAREIFKLIRTTLTQAADQ